ncbi:mycothiol transferase [Arthrobacter rhombi]|uniref:mycothiol transferase n=1 Tax=Arthrobacter rhombi TaxID=71253 RepID=UPI003FD1DE35
MPAMPGPVADEKSLLLAFLDQQRTNLRTITHGLTEAQSRSTPSASALSIGALIKHVNTCEASWMSRVAAAPHPPAGDAVPFGEAVARYADQYTVTDAETLHTLLAELEAQEHETTRIVQAVDLDAAVPVPRNAPWFPPRYRCLVHPLGPGAPDRGDRPALRACGHHPRNHRWGHLVRVDGRRGRLEGNGMAEALDSAGRPGPRGNDHLGIDVVFAGQQGCPQHMVVIGHHQQRSGAPCRILDLAGEAQILPGRRRGSAMVSGWISCSIRPEATA